MIMIVDGNNLAHRARHVFNLSNKGVDVSVTYGTMRTLFSTMQKFNPSSVIVAWDGGVPEYRRQAIPSYKANRTHGADDPLSYLEFQRQIDELHKVVFPLCGILSVKGKYIEADDLVYHASLVYEGDAVIVSNDKDLLQAVCDRTRVYLPGKDLVVDTNNFEEVTGIDLANYVHWRAIQGDSSDNIPGVPGIGEKTATKLFKEYGSLAGITDAANSGKLAERLNNGITTFGMDAIAKNIYATSLSADRTGSRKILINGANSWKPAKVPDIKKYLMRNAFTSLMNQAFLVTLMKLKSPTIVDTTDMLVPVVCHKRFPLSEPK